MSSEVCGCDSTGWAPALGISVCQHLAWTETHHSLEAHGHQSAFLQWQHHPSSPRCFGICGPRCKDVAKSKNCTHSQSEKGTETASSNPDHNDMNLLRVDPSSLSNVPWPRNWKKGLKKMLAHSAKAGVDVLRLWRLSRGQGGQVQDPKGAAAHLASLPALFTLAQETCLCPHCQESQALPAKNHGAKAHTPTPVTGSCLTRTLVPKGAQTPQELQE